jgi:hypothetical protein
MQPFRQIINDAPSMFALPIELHHKRVEIIIWPLFEQPKPAPSSLKSLLMNMPDVGNDNDFARQRDFGRGGETWDF